MSPTVTFNESEQRILNELLDAGGYARKASVLAQVLEVGESELRAIIRELRLKGVVVCSNQNGFFLAQGSGQAEATSRHLWQRVKAIAVVARAFDRARKKKFGSSFTVTQQVEMVFGPDACAQAEEPAEVAVA